MHVDSSVPKECSDPVFYDLSAAFEYGEYKKLRGLPVYKIEGNDDDWYYVGAKPKGKDGIEIFGWVNIKQKPGWKVYTVEQSFVFPNARGQGWGKLLYDTIISREKIMLASGSEQSRMGRRMWKTMVKSDAYTIWAHDFRNTNNYADVIYDEEEDKLVSPLKLYDRSGYYAAHDIRLIAIKKVRK